jgi:hypothetical protein
MTYLFIKTRFKEKSLYYFHKKLKNLKFKKPQNPFLVGFFRWFFFGFFWVGFLLPTLFSWVSGTEFGIHIQTQDAKLTHILK